jgi:hypothetical protein
VVYSEVSTGRPGGGEPETEPPSPVATPSVRGRANTAENKRTGVSGSSSMNALNSLPLTESTRKRVLGTTSGIGTRGSGIVGKSATAATAAATASTKKRLGGTTGISSSSSVGSGLSSTLGRTGSRMASTLVESKSMAAITPAPLPYPSPSKCKTLPPSPS